MCVPFFSLVGVIFSLPGFSIPGLTVQDEEYWETFKVVILYGEGTWDLLEVQLVSIHSCWELAKTLSLFFGKHHIQELLCSAGSRTGNGYQICSWNVLYLQFLPSSQAAFQCRVCEWFTDANYTSSTQGRTFCMSTKQREEDHHINDFCLFLMQQAARPTVAGFFGKNNELHSSLKVTRSTQRQVLWQYHINSKAAGHYWSAPFSADGLQGFTLQSWKYSCSLAFDQIPEIRSRIQSNLFHTLQVHSLQVNAVQKAEYVWTDGQEGQKGIRFNEMRSKTKVIQNDIPAGSLDFPEWSFDGSRYSLHGLCTQIIVMLVCHIHAQCWSPAWIELNSVTAVSSYWLIFLYFCNMCYDMLMLYALLVSMFDHQPKPSERFVIVFDHCYLQLHYSKAFGSRLTHWVTHKCLED